MDIVVIFNGLGNQMSQYAFYLAKKHKNPKCRFIFDKTNKLNHNGYELNKLFGIEINENFEYKFLYFLYQLKKNRYFSPILRLLSIKIIGEDKRYIYNKDFVERGSFGINYYWGGWPSEKHFIDISSIVKETFVFPEQEDADFLNLKNQIDACSNSVSIHIRRGDYLNASNDMYQFGGVTSIDYFNRAIKYLKDCFSDTSFFVFSDDLSWCMEQFIGSEFVFIDCNRGVNSWRDMYMMSLCKHHINSNSTFSWWGAWLSNYSDSITICPREYIRNLSTPDVYPDTWIKI